MEELESRMAAMRKNVELYSEMVSKHPQNKSFKRSLEESIDQLNSLGRQV